MASGNTLVVFTPLMNEPPSSNPATPDLRNIHPVLDYDTTTAESAVFTGVLPSSYAGGGLTVTVIWAASTATSGAVVWSADIERMANGGTDMDADSFVGANNSSAATTNATSGILTYTTITFTDGADMDSLAATEAFRMKIARVPGDAGDTMAGDAELFAVVIKET